MTTEDAIKVLEEQHYILDPRNFERCAKINLALDMAIRSLRRELYKEEKKKKKKKKEYPCKHCVYGTYMTVEDMWWCSRYLMYGTQVARNYSNAKCLKGVTNDKDRADMH